MKMKQSFQRTQQKTVKDFFEPDKTRTKNRSSDKNSFFQKLLDGNQVL